MKHGVQRSGAAVALLASMGCVGVGIWQKRPFLGNFVGCVATTLFAVINRSGLENKYGEDTATKAITMASAGICALSGLGNGVWQLSNVFDHANPWAIFNSVGQIVVTVAAAAPVVVCFDD